VSEGTLQAHYREADDDTPARRPAGMKA
jgi:hypothetical protein